MFCKVRHQSNAQVGTEYTYRQTDMFMHSSPEKSPNQSLLIKILYEFLVSSTSCTFKFSSFIITLDITWPNFHRHLLQFSFKLPVQSFLTTYHPYCSKSSGIYVFRGFLLRNIKTSTLFTLLDINMGKRIKSDYKL
jgi:hypothetical protein